MIPPADLRLDHIGVQVRDLDAAIATFSRLFGYRQATAPVLNTRHRTLVVFLEKAGSLPLKLISPVGTTVDAAAKLHHLAFRVDDIEAAVAGLAECGARVLSPPAPGEAFEEEPIAFLFAGGLNVELIATDLRRDRLEAADVATATLAPANEHEPARLLSRALIGHNHGHGAQGCNGD